MSDLQIVVAAFSAVCALIFLPIAAFFYFTGRKYQALAAASAAWPTVLGKVIECSVIEQQLANAAEAYRPAIRYEYAVAGVRYEDNVVQFGSLFMAVAEAAQKIVEPYPGGATVTVHYNPDDPKLATLETSPAAADLRLRMAKGALLLGFAIYAGLIAFAIFAEFGP